MKRLIAAVLVFGALCGVALAAGPPGNPVVWLDPDYGLVDNGNGTVTWTNSGSWMGTFEGSGSVGTANGRPTLNWGSGLASSEASAAFSATTTIYVFAVWDLTRTSGNGGKFEHAGSYYSWGFTMPKKRSDAFGGVGCYPTGTWAARPMGSLWIDETRMAGGVVDVFINGVNDDDVPGNVIGALAKATAKLWIGSQAGNVNFSGGRCSEFLVYTSPVNPNAVGAYLQKKYGIRCAYQGAVPVAEPVAIGLLGLALLAARRTRRRSGLRR